MTFEIISLTTAITKLVLQLKIYIKQTSKEYTMKTETNQFRKRNSGAKHMDNQYFNKTLFWRLIDIRGRGSNTRDFQSLSHLTLTLMGAPLLTNSQVYFSSANVFVD